METSNQVLTSPMPRIGHLYYHIFASAPFLQEHENHHRSHGGIAFQNCRRCDGMTANASEPPS